MRENLGMRRLAAAIVLLAAIVPASRAGGEQLVVAALRSKDIQPYNLAIKGFEDYLRQKGISAWIVPYDIEGGGGRPDQILEEVKQKKPNLILTLGTRATEAAAASVGDIPVVFCVLLNPGAGMLKGGNVTGVTMDIPFTRQFEVMHTIIPSARSVGVLYDPGETGSVVASARQAAKSLDLELVATPVTSEKEVPDRLGELSRKADVVWMLADGTVYTAKSTEYILQYTLKREIPFVGLSSKYVRAGALFAVAWDYQDLGAQAGELAHRIIGGAAPSSLPVAAPRKVLLVLNLRSARNLGLKLPQRIIDEAAEVYD